MNWNNQSVVMILVLLVGGEHDKAIADYDSSIQLGFGHVDVRKIVPGGYIERYG